MPHHRGPRPACTAVLMATATLLFCRCNENKVSALALTQQEVNTEKAASWTKVQVIVLI